MTCAHCGIALVDAITSGVQWCNNCVSEESNLLNSLELTDGVGKISYPDGFHFGRNHISWNLPENRVKIEVIPPKVNQ